MFIRIEGKPSFGEVANFIACLRRDLRWAIASNDDRVVRECGYALMNAASIIDVCTTLAQRCELLNVNVADREGLSESDGLAALIFDHGKEDSAASRHLERKDGPLFHAINRVFIDFLMTTHDGQPGGRCMFSPGGLFFDSLFYPPGRASTATLH
ncbi:hypothetical protein [Burkholderia ambifaria]|uniref:hypothetical protein n=1 Tax=Burkholderia ambifaria TaxID=152480 RepID=UPI00158DC067|nr:hypothetical protein [Burkholderia ambifaria]